MESRKTSCLSILVRSELLLQILPDPTFYLFLNSWGNRHAAEFLRRRRTPAACQCPIQSKAPKLGDASLKATDPWACQLSAGLTLNRTAGLQACAKRRIPRQPAPQSWPNPMCASLCLCPTSCAHVCIVGAPLSPDSSPAWAQNGLKFVRVCDSSVPPAAAPDKLKARVCGGAKSSGGL